jgi:hypothetical protein
MEFPSGEKPLETKSDTVTLFVRSSAIVIFAADRQNRRCDMRLAFAGAALFAISVSAAAASPTRDIEKSWGKPGVSPGEYHLDASICASEAMAMDISQTAPAKRLAKASRELDTIYETASMYNPGAAGISFGNPYHQVPSVLQAYRVDESFKEIRKWQIAVLEGCLKGLGYRQFALTEDQRRRLKKLPLRTDRRRAYLHSLARDPLVLSRQGV